MIVTSPAFLFVPERGQLSPFHPPSSPGSYLLLFSFLLFFSSLFSLLLFSFLFIYFLFLLLWD